VAFCFSVSRENMDIKKSGFIAIVGRPNVGKSTLLNKILGEKIAIVSNKPQTTRNRIMGILNLEDTQIVFLDTPGFHKPRTRLGEFMVKTVNQTIGDVDVVLLVVEAQNKINPIEIELIEKIKKMNMPTILVINKVDMLDKKEILIEQISKFSELHNFSSVIPISALNGDGVDILLHELKAFIKEGPMFFPLDMITDQPEKILVAEIIREKLLNLLSDEIPHGTGVVIEKMKERKSGSGIITDIEATIYCEKESHKGIIIGKNGSLLKKVGTQSREEAESFFDCKVNLQLWVKVKDDWRNRQGILNSMGYGE
jgi:GTP-binding protein Era